MIMLMYVIFIILLRNYEKAVRTIIGSSERDYVFQLYGSKTGLFEYNLIQFLSKISKIIPSQKTADIIL